MQMALICDARMPCPGRAATKQNERADSVAPLNAGLIWALTVPSNAG